jgi:cobalt-zinc-cadmium efflux system outer membrane protein
MPSPDGPPAIGALTLDAALAMAADRSPALSAARNELEAAEGGVTQAGVLPNPEVAVLLEDTRRDSRATTAQLNVPLELGGKRAARLGAAGKFRELARSQLTAARVEVRSAVYAAFFNVLVAQERARLARDATALAANASRVATRRVAAGKAAPLEQTKAGVEQANAALEQADADAGLDLARHALASLCGLALADMPAALAQGPALTPAAARPDMAVLENSLDLAPALDASRLEFERRRAVVGLERSRQYPDVTLTVGTRRDNSTDRGTMPVVGVSIPLPLFDRNQGNVYAAMRQADKAADEYRATRVRLATELRQAATQLSVSRTLADTLGQTVVPAASQAYDAAVRGFEAGKFAFLDVLDAQRTLLQARIRHLNAVAASYQAAAAIDRILGH